MIIDDDDNDTNSKNDDDDNDTNSTNDDDDDDDTRSIMLLTLSTALPCIRDIDLSFNCSQRLSSSITCVCCGKVILIIIFIITSSL